MTASDLIKELQHHIKFFGDQEIVLRKSSCSGNDVVSVSFDEEVNQIILYVFDAKL